MGNWIVVGKLLSKIYGGLLGDAFLRDIPDSEINLLKDYREKLFKLWVEWTKNSKKWNHFEELGFNHEDIQSMCLPRWESFIYDITRGLEVNEKKANLLVRSAK